MNSFPSLYETFPTSHDNLLPIIVPLLFIITAYVFLIKGARERSKHLKLPRYNAIPNSSVKQIPSRKSLRELSGNIDVAIIGSGIGALSNAAVLARQGYKVAVFEQNQTVGGCTHTFEKEGYEFDVGVHYVGGFSSVVRDMYDKLSDGQLKWSKIDRTYDVMYNAKTGERIEVTDDHEEYRNKLTKHFGIDKETWKKFDKACFHAKFWSYVVLQLKLWHPMILRQTASSCDEELEKRKRKKRGKLFLETIRLERDCFCKQSGTTDCFCKQPVTKSLHKRICLQICFSSLQNSFSSVQQSLQ